MFVSLGADNDKVDAFCCQNFCFFSYIHIFLILIKQMLHKNNTRHVHQEVNKGGYKKKKEMSEFFYFIKII